MATSMQPNGEFTPEEHHRRGLALLEAGHGHEGFEHLSRAYLIDPQNARFRSSYALALALVRGQFLGAVELARAAVRQEFYNPDLYLNLARIYLAFDFKADAIRFLRRGLMVDPENNAVQRRLADLGIRRRPPIRFLPRNHAINRFLGRMQARVLGRAAWVATRMQGA
jgi:predicted Zn-dependent protease